VLFRSGTPGDATVLEIADGRFQFEDVKGLTREGTQRLVLEGMVLGGRWWEEG